MLPVHSQRTHSESRGGEQGPSQGDLRGIEVSGDDTIGIRTFLIGTSGSWSVE